MSLPSLFSLLSPLWSITSCKIENCYIPQDELHIFDTLGVRKKIQTNTIIITSFVILTNIMSQITILICLTYQVTYNNIVIRFIMP